MLLGLDPVSPCLAVGGKRRAIHFRHQAEHQRFSGDPMPFEQRLARLPNVDGLVLTEKAVEYSFELVRNFVCEA